MAIDSTFIPGPLVPPGAGLTIPDLYIIDISNIMHRAFHVHKDLTTPDGLPTGAIHGTFSMLCSMIKTYDIRRMLICYDHPGEESFRKSIYPGYKASRGKREGISHQELIIRKIIELLGIATVEKEGYEADDLIATATRIYQEHSNVVIVTGDKDLLQLIGPFVTVLDTMKKCFYGDAEVMKKFGVKPNQISDFLAIAGDTVDDIPGVAKVGFKGASKLLTEYGSLQGIYDHVSDIPGALGKNMIAGREMAFLSQKLSHLYDLELAPDLDFTVNPKYNEDLLSLFEKLHFTANTKKLTKLWKDFA